MHLYERIFEDLRRAIDEGDIGPGERLPSIRDVAERYDCNKLTAGRAFELLARSGRVENRVGAGTFARMSDRPDSGPGDFSTARLCEEFFPYDEAGVILAGLLASERGRVFSAPEPRGEARLIDALALRFDLDPASLLVTGGAQQGLDLARRLFAGAGRAGIFAVVEEPSYPGALSALKPKAAVKFGPHGPEPAELEAAFASAGTGPRLYYTVPQIHNPTGRRHSLETKKSVARLSEKLDFYIIEDDYLSELLPDRLPRYVDLVPARTIWIKSLSKTMAPGIRIGALAAPPTWLPKLQRLRDESDQGPSTWLQLFAAGVIESGLFDRHLEKVRAVADKRRGELSARVKGLPGLEVAGGDQGYNLWVRSEVALSGSLEWAEGWRFGRDPETRRCFRLSFMGIPEQRWAEASSRLIGALKQAMQQGRGPSGG